MNELSESNVNCACAVLVGTGILHYFVNKYIKLLINYCYLLNQPELTISEAHINIIMLSLN